MAVAVLPLRVMLPVAVLPCGPVAVCWGKAAGRMVERASVVRMRRMRFMDFSWIEVC